jgi:dTMP kinase
MTLNYISFEGIDGAGKSLQLSLLGSWLDACGTTPISLHEPSFGPVGREIRDLIANHRIGGINAQHALFTRDRRDHVQRKILPLLDFIRKNPDFIILQSRSYISAAAYQSASDDLSELDAVLREQEGIAPPPELVVILDLPAEHALARLKRGRTPDDFETLETLRKVRSRYMKIAGIRSQCVLIDAMPEPEVVAEQIRAVVESRRDRA